MNINKIYRKVYYQLCSLFEFEPSIIPSKEPIDIIIPIIEKDLPILHLCIQGIRKYVTNQIKDIYLVAPDTPMIKNFSKDNQLMFIDEKNIFGYGPKQIKYMVNNTIDRSGWIFQQLLKLSGEIGTCSHFLVIDADHILLRPHTFLSEEGKSVFYRSKEFHMPYYKAINQLLGKHYMPTLSYVAHKMIFSKDVLNKLKREIKFVTGKKWDQAILSILDKDQISCFSEYEIYGNFYPDDQKISRLFKNKHLTYKKLASLEKLQSKFKNHYRAVTFPEYKNHK